MANVYTSDNFITSLRRRGQIASSPQALDTSDFLAFLTDEVQTYMMTLLMGVREDHGLANYDVTPTTGTASYALPPRAVGSKLKQVQADMGAGFVPLPRLENERVADYGTTGNAVGYYLMGNNVVLVPSASGITTLRMVHIRRPSRVVATTAAGEITAINTGTKAVTVSSAPTTFTTAVTYDFVKGTPGFDCVGTLDVAVSGVAGNVLTFTNALPTGLAVGDFVCLSGESPIPQIPVELHPLLAQRVVVKCLEALGDPKSAVAKAMCDEQRTAALTLLTPRVEGTPRYLINRNGPGFGRWRR